MIAARCNWAGGLAGRRPHKEMQQLTRNLCDMSQSSLSHYTHSHSHTSPSCTEYEQPDTRAYWCSVLRLHFCFYLQQRSIMCRQCQQHRALQITANDEFAKQWRNWRRPTVRCSLDVCCDERRKSGCVVRTAKDEPTQIPLAQREARDSGSGVYCNVTPCLLVHFLLEWLTLEDEGIRNRRNVGNQSPGDNVSHPGRTAS
jgi:hypothetical protein